MRSPSGDIAYDVRYVALRYFNAAGASPTRDIGEDHNPESHLIPLIYFYLSETYFTSSKSASCTFSLLAEELPAPGC